MSSSGNTLQKAVSSGSVRFTKALDMFWSEFEKGMEQGGGGESEKRDNSLVGRRRASSEQDENIRGLVSW